VVGLGTQDDHELALDFVEQTGTVSFPMLWDETGASWLAFGIASQPAAVLLAPDGSPITGWVGPFPEDEVLELAAAG
jgi:hypothetical protein